MATALLIMDFEMAMVGQFKQPEPLLSSVQATLAAARSAEIPIIYVAVKFREGYPEVDARNKFFSALKQGGNRLQESTDSVNIHPDIAPQSGDIQVTKRRVSAFTGSDLEVILRAGKIDHLVLCGISTSGVVLSTTREASDKDFQITILSDCCADADAEVHQLLLTKVFPRQATVMTHEEWVGELGVMSDE